MSRIVTCSKYADVRAFEQGRNWRRKLREAEDREVLRHVLKSRFPG